MARQGGRVRGLRHRRPRPRVDTDDSGTDGPETAAPTSPFTDSAMPRHRPAPPPLPTSTPQHRPAPPLLRPAPPPPPGTIGSGCACSGSSGGLQLDLIMTNRTLFGGDEPAHLTVTNRSQGRWPERWLSATPTPPSAPGCVGSAPTHLHASVVNAQSPTRSVRYVQHC